MIIFLALILLVIYTVVCMIGSIVKKRKTNWYSFFESLIYTTLAFIAAVISFFLPIFGLKMYTNDVLGLFVLGYFELYLLAAFLFVAILGTIIYLCMKKRLTDEPGGDNEGFFSKRFKKRLIIAAAVVLATGLIQELIYIIPYHVEEYNKEKNKNNEIVKMADYLNDKYDLALTKNDCICYFEEDYETHRGFLSVTNYNVPNYAVFDNGGEQIIATDREGFVSDNRQIKEFQSCLIDYFEELTGVRFSAVIIEKAYIGDRSGDDNVIGKVLQTKINQKITNDNKIDIIEDFMNEIFNEDCIALYFYLNRDGVTSGNIEDITSRLMMYCEKENLVKLNLYIAGEDEEISVIHSSRDFLDEEREFPADVSGYEYGYTAAEFKKYYCKATLNLNRGYDEQGRELEWTFKFQ